MQVVASLRQPSVYRDRFQVFLSLAEHVHHVTLLTDELDEDSKRASETQSNFSVVELGHRRYAKASTRWLVENVVRPNTPTIIHSTFGHLVGFFETFSGVDSRNYRLVHTQYTANHDWFRETRFQDFPMSFNYLGQRVKSFWLDRRMASNSDRVLAVCPSHLPGIRKAHGLADTHVSAVPSEVNTLFFNPKTLARRRPLTLLFVGACYKNKGLDVLFDALPSVFEHYPNLRVELYGRTVRRQIPWLMSELERVSQFGTVRMHGAVDRTRLREAFHGAELLVSPSRFEGSPRAVREALASGCPALLSDIPGHRGFDPERSYIRYVDGYESVRWSKSILDCINRADDEWYAVARHGIENMAARYAPEVVAAALREIYRSIL